MENDEKAPIGDEKDDAEIAAMAEIAESFKKLPDEDAIGRVVRWVNDRYVLGPRLRSVGGGIRTRGTPEPEDVDSVVGTIGQLYGELSNFCEAASPSTVADRTLVVAYWKQFVEGEGEFASQAINKALKHLGHGVANITAALTRLQSQRPALVMQVRKAGTTQQARKRYKLTYEGKRAVEQMIALAQ